VTLSLDKVKAGMTLELATALFNEAKTGGYEADPLPAEDSAVIAKGAFWAEEVIKVAESQAMKSNKTVQTMFGIIQNSFGEPDDGPQADAQEPEEPVSTLPEADSAPPAATPAAEGDAAPPAASESEGSVGSLPIAPLPLAQKENLPIPPDIVGEPPTMPFDITGTDDLSLRKLHSQFNACLARVDYLLSLNEVALANAKIVYRDTYDTARIAVPKLGPDEKRRLSEDIDAETRTNADVKKWTAEVANLEQEQHQLKAFRDIYARYISVLSRDWSMRTDEWQKAGGGAK
jgi:hypothetical protein